MKNTLLKSSKRLLASAPVIALSSQANAAVVVTNTDTGSGPFEIPNFGNAYFDFVTGNFSADPVVGSTAFRMNYKTTASPAAINPFFFALNPTPTLSGHGVAVTAPSGSETSLLGEGVQVSALNNFRENNSTNGTASSGVFFTGFEFDISGNTHYGWAQFETTTPGSPLIFQAFAYEDTPNTSITTEAIPEPGSLAYLVAGSAAALTARRRRRKIVEAA